MYSKISRLRNKILLIFIPIVILSLIITTYSFLYITRNYLLEDYQVMQTQIENNLISSLKLIDSGYRMLEEKLNEELNKELYEFVNLYNHQNGKIENINLTDLKSKYNDKFDFYIIDENTKVIKTTDKKAVGFVFSEFSSELGKKINEIRLNNQVYNERLRTNITTGFLSTWAYIPTKDNKYIFEIGYSADELKDIITDLDPLNIADRLKKTNPAIKDIRIFDSYGYQFVSTGKNYKPTRDSKKIVEQAKTKKNLQFVSANLVKTYLYFSPENSSGLISSHDKIIEISFSRDFVTGRIKTLNLVSFIFLMFFIAVTVLIIFFLSKNITSPIERLKLLTGEIAKGNFKQQVEIETCDEIGDFAKAFNSMSLEIQKNFKEIERQKNEIEEYNQDLTILIENKTKEIVETKDVLDKRDQELGSALAEIKNLEGLLPICSNCKKIRDKNGNWLNTEEYISEKTHTELTHSLCPTCFKKLYPRYTEKREKK